MSTLAGERSAPVARKLDHDLAAMQFTITTAAAARILLVIVLGTLTAWSLRNHPIPSDELARRLPRCVAGLACFGVGIALFFRGDLGNPPWDVLHGGLAKSLDLPVGLVVNLVGVVVLLLWIPLRERVGLGTVLNTLEIGLVLDLALGVLSDPTSPVVRALYTVSGLVIIAVGSGLYIGSGLGAGPRDGIMMGLRRFNLSVRVSRTLIEVVTMGLGFLLGGRIGAGTFLFMFGIGPLVQLSLQRFSLPALEKQLGARPAVRPPHR